jgi:hypothetical protein
LKKLFYLDFNAPPEITSTTFQTCLQKRKQQRQQLLQKRMSPW